MPWYLCGNQSRQSIRQLCPSFSSHRRKAVQFSSDATKKGLGWRSPSCGNWPLSTAINFWSVPNLTRNFSASSLCTRYLCVVCPVLICGINLWSIRNFIFRVDMCRYCRNWHPLIYCFSSIKFSLSMIKDTPNFEVSYSVVLSTLFITSALAILDDLSRWPYMFAVVFMSECPIKSLTWINCTFLLRSKLATVCRRSW